MARLVATSLQHPDRYLARLTIHGTPVHPVGELLDRFRLSFDVFGAVCRSIGSNNVEHFHGLVFGDHYRAIKGTCSGLVATLGLHPRSVHPEPVTGWKGAREGGSTAALRQSLLNIGQYDFALGDHRLKRLREAPVGVEVWGCFLPLASAAVALLAPGGSPCSCGCGRVLRRRADAKWATAACKQRAWRARERELGQALALVAASCGTGAPKASLVDVLDRMAAGLEIEGEDAAADAVLGWLAGLGARPSTVVAALALADAVSRARGALEVAA